MRSAYRVGYDECSGTQVAGGEHEIARDQCDGPLVLSARDQKWRWGHACCVLNFDRLTEKMRRRPEGVLVPSLKLMVPSSDVEQSS